MADTMVCHECGGRMARGAKPVEFEYKGQKIILEQPGWYCASCEESVLTGADMMATEPMPCDKSSRVSRTKRSRMAFT